MGKAWPNANPNPTPNLAVRRRVQVDENVGRLDVSMHNAPCVEVVHGVDEVLGEVRHICSTVRVEGGD